jgi:hypothetical protein
MNEPLGPSGPTPVQKKKKKNLLRAQPHLGEGHLFDAILCKSRQYFIAWQIGKERK